MRRHGPPSCSGPSFGWITIAKKDASSFDMDRTFYYIWRLFTGHFLFVLLIGFGVGCRSDALSSAEQQTLEQIFRSGLEMQDDPYVRAETLRALELTGDPRFAELVRPLTADRDAVVRMAALRLMLRAEHPDAPQRALSIFSRADDDERSITLDIVLEYGPQTLQKTMLDRSLRSDYPRLRLRALQEGLFAQIDDASAVGDEQLLRHELLPELGRLIDDDDPQIAALALTKLIEAGQQERADRFIDRFLDPNAPTEARLAAGQILVRARAEQARGAFESLLKEAGAFDPERLGLPQRRADKRLIRLAVLGLAALGDADFVRPAQDYGVNATTEETLELLEALGQNPSPDAAITLSSAMRDINAPVRRRAIALYGQRDDALFANLQSAMGRSDFEAQKLAAAILAERFPQEWQDYLRQRLNHENPERVEHTLRTMQTLLRTEEELAVIYPLREDLEALATVSASTKEQAAQDADAAEQQNRIASLAAYLLFRISDEGGLREVIRKNRDPQSRYTYLEYLATTDPLNHTAFFRDHLLDDLFALRLMSAAGLASAFADSVHWKFAARDDDITAP